MHPDQNQYVDITATIEDLHEKDKLEDKIDIRVAGDKMRSKGDAEPSTPLKEFTVEVNQSVIDGDVEEY